MKPLHTRFITAWQTSFRVPLKVRQSGFTLLELLVAILIGGIITTGLLSIVVELLKVNTREEALARSQWSAQRALDYIASDLGEAVYVYSNNDNFKAVLDQLTFPSSAAGATPVLAFWRLDPIDVSQVPATCTGALKDECTSLKIRHNTYTLVVYLHQANANGSIWSGQSRILRYELPKYSNISNLTKTAGYADPTMNLTRNTPNSFQDWQRDPEATTTGGKVDVLADYIALPGSGKTCPTGYTKIEPLAANRPKSSFFACSANLTADATKNNNQDENKGVRLYIQGTTTGNNTSQVSGPVSEASATPTLETEVMIRGVLEKPAGKRN